MPKPRSSKQENMEIDGTGVEIQKTEAAKKENTKAEVKVEPEDIKPGSSVDNKATGSESQKSSDSEEDSKGDDEKPINTDRFFGRFMDIWGGLGSLIYDMAECEGTLLRQRDCTDPTCMPDGSEDPGCCKSCLGNDRFFYKVFLNDAYDILDAASKELGQFKG